MIGFVNNKRLMRLKYEQTFTLIFKMPIYRTDIIKKDYPVFTGKPTGKDKNEGYTNKSCRKKA